MQLSKYRPSLTESQIRHILRLAKRESPLSQESVNVIKVLSPFLAKIENEVIAPSYSKTERPSVMESLGVETSVTSSHGIKLSKADYNRICWQKYSESPEFCTLEEIAAAQEHAYIHDLMNEKQEAAYEAEIQKLADSIRKEI